MTKIPSVEGRVEEISWNLRKDIKSICGTYDTVITNKLEKFLTQALTADRTALLTELTQTIQAIDFYGWNEQTQSKIKEKVQAHLDELIKSNSV